jgi:hypothetical protein
MIRGYFDESAQGNVFLIAGWVAGFETWARFTEDWRTALDSEPAIRYFKHHEAKSDPPSGEFAGWSIEAIEAKLTKLVDVICRHQMYGVCSGLNVATHNAAFTSSIASFKQLRSVLKLVHHYHACVFSTHATVIQIQVDRGEHKRVDLVFDEMSGMMAECITFYREAKENFPPQKKAIAGSMTEANDKEVEALQAADLLAGQIAATLRLPPENHYRRMADTHKIWFSRAYTPKFDEIPELVSRFDTAWFMLQLRKAGSQPKAPVA